MDTVRRRLGRLRFLLKLMEKYTTTAHEYARRWELGPDGDIFFTHSSLLWPVTRAGNKLMLKIANPNDDEAYAGEMLAFYGEHGAVGLIESDGHIQLLERIEDIHATLEDLSGTDRDDEATHIICDVIAKLHAATGTPPAHLVPFSSRSISFRRHVDEGKVIPQELQLFKTAYHLSDELIEETKDTFMPLHGDIHHGNILWSSRRGWLAIDPKGINGPRIYEYANMLCNPYAHAAMVENAKTMDRRASIITEKTTLNKELLLQFTFLHAIQCLAWSTNEAFRVHRLNCAQTAASLSGLRLAD